MAWLGQATEVLEGCQLDESWPTKVVNLSRNLEKTNIFQVAETEAMVFLTKKTSMA